MDREIKENLTRCGHCHRLEREIIHQNYNKCFLYCVSCKYYTINYLSYFIEDGTGTRKEMVYHCVDKNISNVAKLFNNLK